MVREATEAAQAAAQRGENMAGLMMELLARAKRTVENTPSLLPVLREAGVVDAGGQGLYYFFEGMSRVITGLTSPAAANQTASVAAVSEAEQEYGFEVQLLIEGENMPIDALRDRLAGLGESVLVVGDESLIRVHIHTERPDEVLEITRATGKVSDVEVTNLDSQAEEFRGQH